MSNDAALLGLAEVADLLQTSRQTIGNWRQRRADFPAPVADLRSGPIWQRDLILAWAQRHEIAVANADAQETPHEIARAGTTISLMNMKGGVGKSTLTANLGWYCAYQKNQRVLVVDLDPQFNLSQYVLGTTGYEAHLNAHKATVLDIFELGTPRDLTVSGRGAELAADDVIASAQAWDDGSCIHIIPSALELSFTLRNPSGKEHLLAGFLDKVRHRYDLVLIDCAPTESMLTTAAYLASEAVLIPVKPEFLSTIGLPLVANSLRDFKQSHNRVVDVLGIVFNSTSDKIEHHRSRSFVRSLAAEHDWYVFRNEISYSDSYPKGSRIGKPIFMTDYARETKIADFAAVADEFFGRLAR